MQPLLTIGADKNPAKVTQKTNYNTGKTRYKKQSNIDVQVQKRDSFVSLQLPCRPRAAKILSSRQLSSVDALQEDECFARLSLGRQRESRPKTREAAAIFASSTVGRNSVLTHKAGNVKKVIKVGVVLHFCFFMINFSY